MSKINPFHLAIPVHNLQKAREFYRDVLGCQEGRSSDHWVDFNFFGHQLVIHYKEQSKSESSNTNPVDGKDVPIPHFGVVLHWAVFQKFSILGLKEKLVNRRLCFFMILVAMH